MPMLINAMVEKDEHLYKCRIVSDAEGGPGAECGACGSALVADSSGWRDCPACGATLATTFEEIDDPKYRSPARKVFHAEELKSRGRFLA